MQINKLTSSNRFCHEVLEFSSTLGWTCYEASRRTRLTYFDDPFCRVGIGRCCSHSHKDSRHKDNHHKGTRSHNCEDKGSMRHRLLGTRLFHHNVPLEGYGMSSIFKLD